MSALTGAQLGPYHVDHRLAAGGMGEVYAATDTRLKRRVAIKVLPASMEKDAQLRARFQREAELISSLHHPHICRLYDVGRTEDGRQYLVLELLEGETLQARLRRGPLPMAQVLRLGSQMADALAAAHRHGIVHRDLKPGNVMLTADGAELLDFGLAKPFVASPASMETMVGDGPVTASGTLTGTLHYMAPEQVQGGTVDARTDIFALGAVLHEMVTAEQAFGGANPASVIAKILDHDPPPVSTKASLAPPALDQLVRTCLAKDPGQRWQSAQDVHLQLEWLRQPASHGDTPAVHARVRSMWRWLPWAVATGAVLLAGAVLLLPRRQAPVAPPPVRFEIPVDGTLGPFDAPELSPDGRRVGYTASQDGNRSLFLRDLDSQETRRIAGTAGASFPFWSPDGQSIGFFADRSLRRVAVVGGVAQTLAQAPSGAGGGWGRGFILFSPSRASLLHRVGENGGLPEPLEVTAEGSSEAVPRPLYTPSLLPDGEHYLALDAAEFALYVGSLSQRTVRKLKDAATPWARVAAGHLVYLQGRRLIARPFDVGTLEFTGTERVLAESAGAMSITGSGSIAFAEPPPLRRLTWVDRTGRVDGTIGELGAYDGVTMSALGRVAAMWSEDDAGNLDIWRLDVATEILSRLTTHHAADMDAALSPDERRLAFTSWRLGRRAIFVKDLTTGEETLLHNPTETMAVDTWAPDGRHVIARTAGRAVFSIAVDGDRKPVMIADTRADEIHVSPDGQMVAFNSSESGRSEVYVARFPGFADKRQISSGGGVQPLWRGDGRELFYLSPDASVMSVRLDAGPAGRTGPTQRLFGTNVEADSGTPDYAVTPDGQRFLLLDRGPRQPDKIHVLLNWLRPDDQ